MNRLIPRDETEPLKTNKTTTAKKNYQQRSLWPDGFTGKFHQTFRDVLTRILLKIFQKIAEEETLPNSYFEASITLIPKPNKDTTHKKENYRPLSLMNTDTNILYKMLQSKFNNTFKWSLTMIKWYLFLAQHPQINKYDIPH